MEFTTPKEFLEKINAWFNGLIALPLLTTSYGYLEIHGGDITPTIASNLYTNSVIIGLLIIGVAFVSFRYRKNIGSIDVEQALNARLGSYFLISKNYFLLIFIFSLVSTILLYVTADASFAGLYALQLFALSIHKPSMLMVANKLNLKGEQRSNFIKKEILS